jgi:Tfp pilus assembly major pilin PilA
MNFRNRFTLVGLLSVIVVIALLSLFTLPALADDAGPADVGAPTTFTNNVVNTTFTGSAVKIDKQHAVDLVVKIQGNAASTDKVVVSLARSGDGTTFETSPPATLKFTNTLNGTTAVIGYHNIPESLIGSAHSIKVVSIHNESATVPSTNSYVKVIKKLER